MPPSDPTQKRRHRMPPPASAAKATARSTRVTRTQIALIWAGVVLLVLVGFCGSASAQSTSSSIPLPEPVNKLLGGGPDEWTSPQGLSSTLQVMLLLQALEPHLENA